MNIMDHFSKFTDIQNTLLEYIENDDPGEDDNIFKRIIESILTFDNTPDLKTSLHLIVKISDYHHRSLNFFNKIEKILAKLKKSIIDNYSNIERFIIFQSNKRLLLYLFKEKIIIPDNTIALLLLKDKKIKRNYHYYFFPEFQTFFSQIKQLKSFNYNEIKSFYTKNSNFFEENREKGENDNYLNVLIQKDSIDEFIQFVNRTNINLNKKIQPSIFETNLFLLKNEPSIIEYSLFNGSIQIFQYLLFNEVRLERPFWIYAVQSQNADLIHLLEQKKCRFYYPSLYESIKCHHNDIANYILNTFNLKSYEKINDRLLFKCYNFNFLPQEIDFNISNLFYLCKYDYISLVDLFLKEKKIKEEINTKIISIYKNFE